MPLRRTKRSDSRQRLRWEDGSHLAVENTHANESRCNEKVLEANHRIEPLVTAPLLFQRSHENEVSTFVDVKIRGAYLDGAKLYKADLSYAVRVADRFGNPV